MAIEDAVKESKNGVIINLEVNPGSRSICIPSGYNDWRKRIEVKLTRNAQKGKANEQLIENLSDMFGLSTSDIEITSGAKSGKKSVIVRGIDYNDVITILRSKLNDLNYF
ncbi:MAG TPA: YggU family protein [Methanosarcinaceae archaeon]|nr:YggU family protein [Methanosarcinaceae archaeon]